MNTIKNISNDPRKVKVKGKYVIILPGESFKSDFPTESNNVFEVIKSEKSKNMKEDNK